MNRLAYLEKEHMILVNQLDKIGEQINKELKK